MMRDISLLANHTAVTKWGLKTRGQGDAVGSSDALEVHMTHATVIATKKIRHLMLRVSLCQQDGRISTRGHTFASDVTFYQPIECSRDIMAVKGSIWHCIILRL